MKNKLFNITLIITSLFGYMEWGKDNHSFLFEAEKEVLSKLFADPLSVVNPFTLLPLFGQLLLLITLFQQKPARLFTFVGMACIALLLLLMFFIGVLGFNFKILISTLPFLITCILVLRHHRKNKTD